MIQLQEAYELSLEENVTTLCLRIILHVFCNSKNNLSKKIEQNKFHQIIHDLQQNGEIIVQQIRSIENVGDLFTKTLSTSMFKKLVQANDYVNSKTSIEQC